VQQDESEVSLLPGHDLFVRITITIRLSCFQGVKGVRRLLTFKNVASTCRVSDVVALVIRSQTSPPEAVDLLHRGCPMNIHSDLLEYDIMSTPTIDAILSYAHVQKDVHEHEETPDLWKTAYKPSKQTFATLLCDSNHMPEPQKRAAQLVTRLMDHTAPDRPHKASDSTLIHMFALIVCLRRGARIEFDLDVGSTTSCLKVSEIKNTLLAWLQRALFEMDLVLGAAEVLVMYTSARLDPLDDDHIFDECGVPSELSAVVSL